MWEKLPGAKSAGQITIIGVNLMADDPIYP